MSPTAEEDPNLKKILDFILKAEGFDGHQYKPNYIKRRIAVRMRASGTTTYQDYLNVLQRDRRESARLFDRLTIHVTEFFRDPDVYRAIQTKVLPTLSNLPESKLKIWCAGCSTGEEPYSVAMMLKEWIPLEGPLSFQILATDIDGPSVQVGEKGEYSLESIRKLSKAQAEHWFYRDDSIMRVSRELKANVRFRVNDLLASWPSELFGFHIIFCRNMLIYLTAPQQQILYARFAKALLPGGHLVLGLTETLLGASRQFYQCVDIKHRIYRVLDASPTQNNSKTDDRMTDG